MVRGKKHKEIADGRTGRNGQKMVCRSTAVHSDSSNDQMVSVTHWMVESANVIKDALNLSDNVDKHYIRIVIILVDCSVQ